MVSTAAGLMKKTDLSIILKMAESTLSPVADTTMTINQQLPEGELFHSDESTNHMVLMTL